MSTLVSRCPHTLGSEQDQQGAAVSLAQSRRAAPPGVHRIQGPLLPPTLLSCSETLLGAHYPGPIEAWLVLGVLPTGLWLLPPSQPGARPTAAVAQLWLMCGLGEGWAGP